jgi:glycerol-3-phosphate O-acyltransferase
MTEQITISLWLFLLLAAVAVLDLLDRILIPGTRWFLRRRINRVLEEIGTRLDIEIRPFQLTKRQVLIDRLAYDPKVMEAVHRYARERDMPLEVAQNKVLRYAQEIVPSFNAYLYFRIGYWAAKKVARWLYRVRVGLLDEQQFAHIDPDSTVVFVMNHRSNMDYVLVAFLAAERTTLSYAVGEWARIWPLQTLIRAMGAFFVRRNAGRNPLYRRVLERYIHMATKEGVCQAVFPEGGLSRDGRMRPPKLGLLDYMLRDFRPGTDRDIVFIPTGINYDRTLEDRSLLREMDPGAEKRSPWFVIRTTLGFLWKSIFRMVLGRWERFGYACVNFGTPLSMKSYCRENEIDFSALERTDRFPQVDILSRKLMASIGAVVPILPVSVTAAVFLEAGDRGLDIREVEERALERTRTLQAAGAPAFQASHSTLTRAVAEALHTLRLRRLLVEEEGRYRAHPDEYDLLRYYANAAAHWRQPGTKQC